MPFPLACETKEYHTIDKSDWGNGPWQSEPDKKQWTDEDTGYACLIVRTDHSGHLCGYVGVPDGHPAYTKHYDEMDVSVHGGLTFSDHCQHSADESRHVCHVPAPGAKDNVFWLGFDCAHCDDLSPKYLSPRYAYMHPFGEYRTFEFVEAECKSLAKQLKEIEKSGRL